MGLVTLQALQAHHVLMHLAGPFPTLLLASSAPRCNLIPPHCYLNPFMTSDSICHKIQNYSCDLKLLVGLPLSLLRSLCHKDVLLVSRTYQVLSRLRDFINVLSLRILFPPQDSDYCFSSFPRGSLLLSPRLDKTLPWHSVLLLLLLFLQVTKVFGNYLCNVCAIPWTISS